MTRYLAITPARDEERFLPDLIGAMAAQSCPPARWIIIDDGSQDSTGAIIERAASIYSWIEPWHLSPNRPRREGGESAVMQVLESSRYREFEYILRLDADLSFDTDFVELLLAELARDPELGIVGATLYERHGKGWREMAAPSFHTRGAVKMYSRACLEAIGGLEAGLGWDTIDEVHALMLGFKTRSFRHILAFHHRAQGSSGGWWRGRLAAGRAAYQIGYAPLFLVARALRQMVTFPPLIGGVMLLAGYSEGYLLRKRRAASDQLVRFVRRQQLRRLFFQESIWR